MGNQSEIFVRLGTKSEDLFLQELSQKNEKIKKIFLKNIKKLTNPIRIKTMLADSTVSDQNTFDPYLVQNFYKKIIDNLPNWNSEGISISNNENIRRIFVKFNTQEGNYFLSCHMALQFHVLLFYRPHKDVIQYKKELSTIINKIKNKETKFVNNNDQLILERLKSIGYKDLEHQDLFEVFFKNDELREKIYYEIEAKNDDDYRYLTQRKLLLLKELDSFLIETYQTTPILIDVARLVGGEEGCLCNFDFEFVKNKTREGIIEPKKIPEKIKKKISEKLDQIIDVLKM